MIQKALLTGFIIALSALLAVNLASHRPEAFFLMGWAAGKLWQQETATRMFETGLESSKRDSPIKDRLRVADGASLTNSNFDHEAVGVLYPETNSSEGKEREKLEALRLLALWNARAKDAATLEWTNRKLWFYGALVAYTWSYRIDGNEDSRTNFDIVKKLLDEQVKQDKEGAEKKEKEEQDQDSGWDSRKTDESDKWGSKDGEKKDEKQPENSDSSAKGESKSAWSGKEERKNESDEKNDSGTKSEPPKSWNWTNAGNPASLQSDPGGSRWSNWSVPLSSVERKELEADIKNLSELQKEREKYVRPDGQAQSQDAIPNSLRELFSGDPLFDSMLPQPDSGPNGKSW